MASNTQLGKKPSVKQRIGFLSFNSGSLATVGSPGSVNLPPDEPTPWVPTITVYESPPTKPDTIINPSHYARLNPQPVQVSVNWGLNYLRATALKYLARAGNKEGVDEIEDLRKAISFIEREIKRLKGEPVA